MTPWGVGFYVLFFFWILTITFKIFQVSVGDHIPDSWAMFFFDIYQPPTTQCLGFKNRGCPKMMITHEGLGYQRPRRSASFGCGMTMMKWLSNLVILPGKELSNSILNSLNVHYDFALLDCPQALKSQVTSIEIFSALSSTL